MGFDLTPAVTAIRHFVAERHWAQYHDPKNLAMALASEAGELLGVLRWVSNDHADAFVQEPQNREGFAQEVADVAISLLMLCDRAGLDLEEEIAKKLEINRRNYPVQKVKGSALRPARE